MNNRNKLRPPQPQPSRLEYIPLTGQEDRPPQLTNTFVVTGGTDTLILTFYHISPNTLTRAFGDEEVKWPNVERHGDLVTIRSEPIARVALPFTVAVDMIAEMVESAIGGVPELQSSLASIVTRFAEAMKKAEALSNKPATGPAQG